MVIRVQPIVDKEIQERIYSNKHCTASFVWMCSFYFKYRAMANKDTVLVSFTNSSLSFIKKYDEKDFELASKKFQELFSKKDSQTNVTLFASSFFFEKFIKPVAYREFIETVNSYLDEEDFERVKEGDLMEEFEQGLTEEAAAHKHFESM